jgi:RNA polymerase sigma-70 factor (ECF subfamily)
MALVPVDRDEVDGEVVRLVAAHRSGDPGAFAALARMHYDELFALARRRLGSREDAEDAVQETLFLALRAFPRFGRNGEFHARAWLLRILVNVCHRLRARRRPALPLDDELLAARRPPTATGDVAEQVGDPVAYRRVATAVSRLPDSQRRAFLLRTVGDLPYDELARREGITHHNARARVTRARAQLRDELTVRPAGELRPPEAGTRPVGRVPCGPPLPGP